MDSHGFPWFPGLPPFSMVSISEIPIVLVASHLRRFGLGGVPDPKELQRPIILVHRQPVLGELSIKTSGKNRELTGKTYWCLVDLVGNGWEWGNGMIITSDYGSFPHSLHLAPVRRIGKIMGPWGFHGQTW